MTAPAVNGTRYPQPVDKLLPAAQALTKRLDEVPSRNRLMREFRIGAPKAGELLDLLRADGGAVDQGTPVAAAALELPLVAAPDPGPRPECGPNLRPVFVEPTAGPGTDPGTPAAPQQPDRDPSREASPQVATDGHPVTPGERDQLLRVRWAVRAVLALGVAASIAGNVLHARDELISQVISAWSPLALLLTVELISRVPVHRRTLAVGRWIATALIAGIAAWVSYWHMAAVASRYGETGGAQYLLPLSVDGLVVVASICLVELGGRIAAATKR
ncbi:DUF2637 domain-containing protein [Micromonospora sp. WMMD1120]|uniref:DUF2637 domain-containing protein n=1 Tax=Micromonospora sp. WMMD1120 TaxID=3016106 RepID=UPI0024180C9C|nr:DUF2637 domain-containing protein [Micromonospora sp. WMMD1120]MDG4809954.1 DUF2637 domain-containing protein [Micromonospora sp. WMMD1120]